MTLPNQPFSEVARQLAANWPADAPRGRGVVLAVSGGADSMALVRAVAEWCGQAPAEVTVAHFNHALRGAASDADEELVRRQCAQLGWPCDVDRGTAAQLASAPRDGIEAALRAARYAFLESCARKRRARYVALAHTADDQAETVLHRIIRGTGVAGLSGIPARRELADGITLIRPLLAVRRAALRGYLADLGQPYADDCTNADPRFTRNRIRDELIPRLEADYNPKLIEALLRLRSAAAELDAMLEPQRRQLAARAVADRGPDRLELWAAELAAAPAYLVREILSRLWRAQDWPEQEMGHVQWAAAAALLDPRSGRHDFPGGVRGERRGAKLVFQRH